MEIIAKWFKNEIILPTFTEFIVFLFLLSIIFIPSYLSFQSAYKKNIIKSESNYKIEYFAEGVQTNHYTKQTPIKEGNCIKFDNTEICGTYTIIKLK